MADARAALTGARRTPREPVLPPGAAAFHLLTAVAATSALLLQVGLTTTAGGPAPPVRLLRLFSYFAVESNLIVAVTASLLAIRPRRGAGTLFRVARLDGVVGITVTGLVYLVVLRSNAELAGWWAVAAALLHFVVPALAVVGWFVYGPRRRVDLRVVLLALGWPVGYFAWTFVHGAVSGFYPYPFVNVALRGYVPVLEKAGLVTGLLLLLALTYLCLDRRLDRRARRPRWS
jgi:hypothetical protein